MAAMSGKFFPDSLAGNVFLYPMAAAGAVLPIFSNTAQVYGIWNPQGSGKIIVPLWIELGYVSTTGAAGNFVFGQAQGLGSQIATGSPVTAGTLGTPINANLGGTNAKASIARFFPATVTLAAAPTRLMDLGVSQDVTTPATTSAPQWLARKNFDGELIIGQGSAIFVAGNIATLSTMTVTMCCAEVFGQ